jgi:endogenous inhibitor of DNA gyrase (YacG/DUF329 family)
VTTSPARSVRKCPICGKPASEAVRPFCSAACKSLDLHRWLSGSYAIPVADDEDDTEKGGEE